MNFNAERWYSHQLTMVSQQLAEASRELRLLRQEKLNRELQFQTKPCWLCKRDVLPSRK